MSHDPNNKSCPRNNKEQYAIPDGLDCTCGNREHSVVHDSISDSPTSVSRVDPLPIPMILTCPMCCARHVDQGKFATKAHHTHACQECGMVWRPAIVPTVGVMFLPGFKDAP